MAFVKRLAALRAAGPVGHHGSGPFGPGGGPVLGSKPVFTGASFGGLDWRNMHGPFVTGVKPANTGFLPPVLAGGMVPRPQGMGLSPSAAQAFIAAAIAANAGTGMSGGSQPAGAPWTGQPPASYYTGGYPSVLFGVAPVGAPGGPVASAAVAPAVRPEDYYRPQGGR